MIQVRVLKRAYYGYFNTVTLMLYYKWQYYLFKLQVVQFLGKKCSFINGGSTSFLLQGNIFLLQGKHSYQICTQISRTPCNNPQISRLPIAKFLSPPTCHNIQFCPEGIPQAVQTHAGNYTLPMYKERKTDAETIADPPSRLEPRSNGQVVARNCR